MANNKNKTLTRITTAAIGLAVLATFAVGLYATWLRFSRGLGATTHLSDSVPWGLWIWFTLTRVGLSAGGFILAAVVYLFHYERFHSIIRAAVLTALDSACPLCKGTGILTPNQKRHWQAFTRDHPLQECQDCHELRLICETEPGAGQPPTGRAGEQ